MGKNRTIHLVCSHPHCSHLLQPLNVSCYGPFETAWNVACHTYLREPGGNSITRFDVCKLAASKVYIATLTPVNIQAVFKKCGIYPFYSTVISDSAIAPSLSFARPTPVAPADNQSSSTTEKATNNTIITDLIRGSDITTTASTSSAASGVNFLEAKAITDDQVVQNIKAHIQSQTSKQTKTSITPKIQPQASKKKNSQVPGPSKIPLTKNAKFNHPLKKSVTCTPPTISDSDGDSEVS